jgi:hypothetical protein
LLDQVRAYLEERCAATASLWVAGPDWIEVTVRATVAATSLAQADAVGARIAAALDRFLHPLTGGPRGTGWEFGRVPYRSEIYALIEGITGVDHIRQLDVTPPTNADILPGALIYSGRHQVRLVA